LNAFLNWCIRHDVNSLDEVDANVIANYQRTLLWKFQCSKCGDSVPFESGGPTKKCANEKCEASIAYVKVKNLARNSRISITSRLRVFFDWAFLHQVVTQNPVGSMEMTSGPRAFTIIDERGKSIEVASSIRRYDDSHIEKFLLW
jgi:site-specific recombinase XerD